MSSTYGDNIKISVFGQSHSKAIGVVIDNLPPDFTLNMDDIKQTMARRSAKGKSYATKRAEADEVEIVSGVFEGKTCGAPLCAMIYNNDTRSKDYSLLKTTPRPSHADYCASVKYLGSADYRGGGHFSGRLTAPLVFAGSVANQFLKEQNIRIYARIKSIGQIEDVELDYNNLNEADFVLDKDFATIGSNEQMLNAILQAQSEGDSLGGVIECVAFGVPTGVGEPMFDGIENKISQAIFAIPAVKGIEFGQGFAITKLKGSVANDNYAYENGEVKTTTNNNGGILGGIANGMPIIFRVAIKPTPSIFKEQQSVNLSTKEDTLLKIEGRHDPCIVPRAVVCVEMVTALAIFDLLLGR